jgi:hypothetical protein
MMTELPNLDTFDAALHGENHVPVVPETPEPLYPATDIGTVAKLLWVPESEVPAC